MKPIFVAFRAGRWTRVCRRCPGITWEGYMSASDAADSGRFHIRVIHP